MRLLPATAAARQTASTTTPTRAEVVLRASASARTTWAPSACAGGRVGVGVGRAGCLRLGCAAGEHARCPRSRPAPSTRMAGPSHRPAHLQPRTVAPHLHHLHDCRRGVGGLGLVLDGAVLEHQRRQRGHGAGHRPKVVLQAQQDEVQGGLRRGASGRPGWQGGGAMAARHADRRQGAAHAACVSAQNHAGRHRAPSTTLTLTTPASSLPSLDTGACSTPKAASRPTALQQRGSADGGSSRSPARSGHPWGAPPALLLQCAIK